MTRIRVSLVDLYVLRGAPGVLECLVLRRAAGGRCPGSWEAVHGHIEDGETPADAARRSSSSEPPEYGRAPVSACHAVTQNAN